MSREVGAGGRFGIFLDSECIQNLGCLAAQLDGVNPKKHGFSMREFEGVPMLSRKG